MNTWEIETFDTPQLNFSAVRSLDPGSDNHIKTIAPAMIQHRNQSIQNTTLRTGYKVGKWWEMDTGPRQK